MWFLVSLALAAECRSTPTELDRLLATAETALASPTLGNSDLPGVQEALGRVDVAMECQRSPVSVDLLRRYAQAHALEAGMRALSGAVADATAVKKEAAQWVHLLRRLDSAWAPASSRMVDTKLVTWAKDEKNAPSACSPVPEKLKGTRLIVNGKEAEGLDGFCPAFVQVIWPGDGEVHQSEMLLPGESLRWTEPPLCPLCLEPGDAGPDGCGALPACAPVAPIVTAPPACPACLAPGESAPPGCESVALCTLPAARPSGLKWGLAGATGVSLLVATAGLVVHQNALDTFNSSQDPLEVANAFNGMQAGSGMGMGGAAATLGLGVTTALVWVLTGQGK